MKNKLFISILLAATLSGCPESKQEKKETLKTNIQTTKQVVREVEWSLPKEKSKSKEVQYGYELISNTSRYIGPDVAEVSMRYAGNHMACKNCHLNSGQQANAIGFVGITHRYPRYRGRENRKVNLKERINGCMERSLNGKALPMNSPEMEAMLAYMKWMSDHIPADANIKGRRLPEIELLSRAADPETGKSIYQQKCKMCHQTNGEGLLKNEEKLSEGYLYPPLWGSDSYNNGAGMHRVITAAKYIKANMPFGSANLTTEEAFDVAAYIDSQKRPIKPNLEKDYPELSKKPVDSPYPPYADQASVEQHKYGPFKDLINKK